MSDAIEYHPGDRLVCVDDDDGKSAHIHIGGVYKVSAYQFGTNGLVYIKNCDAFPSNCNGQCGWISCRFERYRPLTKAQINKAKRLPSIKKVAAHFGIKLA